MTCWLLVYTSLLSTSHLLTEIKTESRISVRNVDLHQSHLSKCKQLQEDLHRSTQNEETRLELAMLWTSLNCSKIPIWSIKIHGLFARMHDAMANGTSQLAADGSTASFLEHADAAPTPSTVKPTPHDGHVIINRPGMIPPALDQPLPPPHTPSPLSSTIMLGSPVAPQATAEPFRSRLLQARSSILWRYNLSDGARAELEQIPPDIAPAVGAEYISWDRARQSRPPPSPQTTNPSADEPSDSARSGVPAPGAIKQIWIWGECVVAARLSRRSAADRHGQWLYAVLLLRCESCGAAHMLHPSMRAA